MRLKTSIFLLCAATFSADVAGGQRPGAGGSAATLDGVWSMVRRTWTVGDSAIYAPATYEEPGQLIIAGRYYSLLYVFTDTRRPLLPTGRDPTDAELARLFNVFYASAGRVERTDSTLTIYLDLVKLPRHAAAAAVTQRWRIRGDTLMLTRSDQVSSADAATARPVTRTTYYVRAP